MDDEYMDDIEEHGSSRRDALKKIGVAAGVVWATPVVMSLSSPAGAQDVGSVRPEPRCEGQVCGQFTFTCSTNTACGCITTPSGGFCVTSTQCASLAACGADNSCPPGFVCAIDSCCVSPVCIPVTLTANCPPVADGFRSSRVTPRQSNSDTLLGT